MKKLNTIMLSALLLFILSCSKDGGYYEPPQVDKEFNGSIYEYLQSKPNVYDSLLVAIERIGAEQMLRDSNVTLFAVTNPGFQIALTNLNNVYSLTEKPAQYLTSVRYNQLDTMINQYIIKGQYNTDSLRQQDGLEVKTARFGYPMHAKLSKSTSSGYTGGGPEFIVLSDTRRSQFNRDWIGSSTASVNIKTRNGIVHVMSPDHVFGFDNFISRLTFNPPPPNLFQLVGGKQTVSRESNDGANGVEGSNNIIDGDPKTKLFLSWNPADFSVTYELATPTVAGAYTITSGNDLDDRDPTDWTFQGSLDGENWVTLDRKSNHVFEERMQQKVYRFSNRVAFKFYKLHITRNNGSSGMQFADWTVNLAN